MAGHHDSGARIVSDVGAGLVIAGSAGLLLPDGGLVDLAMGVETLLVTSAAAVVTMMAVRRPRPFAENALQPIVKSGGRHGSIG